MNIVVIDNYDSFTYNLIQYLGSLGFHLDVYRNDEITISALRELHPDGILISPGPGRPEDAGISKELIRTLRGEIPIFGVCQGYQCMGAVFGADIVEAPTLMHGKTSSIRHDGRGVFRELSSPFEGARYHSLVLDENTLPDSFEITARTGEGTLMGIRHRSEPLWGIQFHPESILTEQGMQLMQNFVDLVEDSEQTKNDSKQIMSKR